MQLKMSGKDWNDLDAGGSGASAPKRGTRPDLQEKMRRRYQHRNQDKMHGSDGKESSPVPGAEAAMGQAGAHRQVPEDSAAPSSQSGRRGKNRGGTPELNNPDSNGNLMFYDGQNSPRESRGSSAFSPRGQGRNPQGQPEKKPAEQNHFDKTLNSVLGELDKDEKSKRRQKNQGEASAVFENNFDDLDLNIPAGGAPGGRQGSRAKGGQFQGGKNNDQDDAMMGQKQDGGNGPDPMQEILRSVMGGGQNRNDRGDPLGGLLAGRQGGDENAFAAMMGGLPGRNGGAGRGQLNDNDDPIAALLGAGGRDPLAAMMGGANAQNAGNNLMSSLIGDRSNPVGQDPLEAGVGGGQKQHGKKGSGKDKTQDADKEKEDSDSEEDDDEDDDESMEDEDEGDLREPKEDPVRKMLEEMTKDMKGSGNPLGALGVAGAGKPGKGVGGEEENKNSDPMAALLGGRGGGGSGMNPFSMRGVGRGGGDGGEGSGLEKFAGLLGQNGQGGRGGGGGGSGLGGLAGLLRGNDQGGVGGGGGDSGLGGLAGLLRGNNQGGNGGDPFAALRGGGGGGGGGQGAGDNPLLSMFGGGGRGNPLSAVMGGGSRDGGGGGGANPLSAFMGGSGMNGGGAGGNPLSAIMGGAGRGGGGFAGLAGLSGGGGAGGIGAGGDQMSQALASVMGGTGGGGRGGMDTMSSAMSALTGGAGRGRPGGPQEQLLRQMAGQVGQEEEVTPENAGENEIIQQLLAYEMMRAQSNRAPRSESASNTIIIVDTSGSMDGEPLREAGQFISQFINGLEELQFEYNLQENVALVCVGGETQVVQHFTNDYALIRRATDSLSAYGSSRLHMGLLLPTSLLSHGSHDTRGMGGVCQMNGHVICPRVIFISDGYPNPTDDIPGQYPRPEDKMLLSMQSLCVELTNTVIQKTLCKFYCVPVGNANLNFMEILSNTSGGRVVESTRAKHMSRCVLHHYLVSTLRELYGKEPTREAIAELLQKITATADEDDINGVIEVIREGEPDLQARDQLVSQEMMQQMQGRGRGRGGGGGGGMQGLGDMAGLLGQGQGQMPGGLQSMFGLTGSGGRGGGFPMIGNRGQSGGGGMPMTGGGQGPMGQGGIPSMFGMGGGRGQGGGGGMEDFIRGGGGGGGGGGLGGLMGMGGGGRGDGMGGLGALLGMGGGVGRGGGSGGGNGMEALMRMAGGGNGRGRGSGGNEALMGGGGGLQDMLRGGGGEQTGQGQGELRGLQAMLGMGGKSGGQNPGQGIGDGSGQANNGGLGAMLNMGGGAGGLEAMFGGGGGRNQTEQQRGGMGQLGGLQAFLGMGGGGKNGHDAEVKPGDNKRQSENAQLELLGMGNEDNESGQGKSLFSHLPGGSLQAMLGMGDVEKPGGAKGSSKKNRQQGGDGQGEQSMGVAAGGEGVGSEKVLGMGGEDQPAAEGGKGKKGKRTGSAKKGAERKPKAKKNREAASDKGQEGDGSAGHSNDENAEADRNPQMGGVGGQAEAGAPHNRPQRQNLRGNGLFNNCPPMSFGLDEDGNARNVDLMGGLGGDDKDGDELMKKLASLLGMNDGPNGDGMLDDDQGDDEPNQEGDGGLLGGLPNMLGLGGGRGGGIPGINRPPNLEGAPDDMRAFLQNMSRDSRGQNAGGGGLRDEDGDVIMERLGGLNQSQMGVPMDGFGGGGGNLPFMGGANLGQGGAPFPQGNQPILSLEQILEQMGMGGLVQRPENPPRVKKESSWLQ